MQLLRASSEAEMVALFLRSELSSDRYGAEIRAAGDHLPLELEVLAGFSAAMTRWGCW